MKVKMLHFHNDLNHDLVKSMFLISQYGWFSPSLTYNEFERNRSLAMGKTALESTRISSLSVIKRSNLYGHMTEVYMHEHGGHMTVVCLHTD